MAHSRTSRKLAALGLAAPLLGAAAWAVVAENQDAAAPQAQSEQTVDQRAVEILDQFSSHLSSLDAYSASITQSLKMQSSFGNEDSEENFNLAFSKPNRFALTTTGDDDGEAVVSDGDHLYTYIPMFSTYIEAEAPDATEALFMQLQNDTLMFGSLPTALLTPLLGPGGPDGELGTLRSASYLGTEQLDGAETHRLTMQIVPELTESGRARMQEEMGQEAKMVYFMDAWFSTGDEPQLKQVELDLAKMLREMSPDMFEAMPQMAEMTYTMTMTFADWKTGSEVSDDRFAFSAPEGAEKVGSMDELMAKIEESMAGPSGSPNDLLGKAAPDFEMQLLDGGTVASAQHKGSDILILDFWATWCGPCIRAMPDLMAIAEEYSDRNVILYAVNVRESADNVEAFLKEREWSLKVPMDRDGSVSNKFKVGGIPQTVIVDKDGTVQAVHVGYSPDNKATLKRELDTLLRGEKLATGEDATDE